MKLEGYVFGTINDILKNIWSYSKFISLISKHNIAVRGPCSCHGKYLGKCLGSSVAIAWSYLWKMIGKYHASKASITTPCTVCITVPFTMPCHVPCLVPSIVPCTKPLTFPCTVPLKLPASYLAQCQHRAFSSASTVTWHGRVSIHQILISIDCFDMFRLFSWKAMVKGI